MTQQKKWSFIEEKYKTKDALRQIKTTKFLHQERLTQGNSTGGNKPLVKSDPKWIPEARKECYTNKIAPLWEKTLCKIQYPVIIKIFGKQWVDEKFFSLLSNSLKLKKKFSKDDI